MDPRKGSLENKTSFYYPLLLLSPRKRKALEVLYRFCWAADDIADGRGNPAQKGSELAFFKKNLALAFQRKARDPFFLEFQRVIHDHQMSREPLERVLRGVERDLRPVRFRKFDELRRYALQVAGGPGLASMEIFGFRDQAHRDYAENLGVFLQITNITRDFREDLALGRLYFPMEDFKRFHLDPQQVEEGNSHWRPFVEYQLDRAWSFLEKARKALTLRQRGDLATAEAIAAVYVKLFQKLRNNPDRILRGRTRLSKADKLLSLTGAVGRCGLWKVFGN